MRDHAVASTRMDDSAFRGYDMGMLVTESINQLVDEPRSRVTRGVGRPRQDHCQNRTEVAWRLFRAWYHSVELTTQFLEPHDQGRS